MHARAEFVQSFVPTIIFTFFFFPSSFFFLFVTFVTTSLRYCFFVCHFAFVFVIWMFSPPPSIHTTALNTSLKPRPEPRREKKKFFQYWFFLSHFVFYFFLSFGEIFFLLFRNFLLSFVSSDCFSFIPYLFLFFYWNIHSTSIVPVKMTGLFIYASALLFVYVVLWRHYRICNTWTLLHKTFQII